MGECPLVGADEPEITLSGVFLDFVNETELPISTTDCSLPATAMLELQDYVGPDYVAFGTGGCDTPDHEIWLEGEVLLPNNNWSPVLALEFGVCYEMRFFFEPAELDTCRLARLDVYEPALPELPIYSVGSTSDYLDVGGLVIEPIDPLACEDACTSGEVQALRFTAGAASVEIAPDEFPWTTLAADAFDLQVIRYDAYAITPSQDANCPGGAPLQRSAWAAKRAN